MRLAAPAPAPAARPGRGTPRGAGGRPALPALRGDFRAHPGSRRRPCWHPGSLARRGTEASRGQTESAGGGPPQPAFLLSFHGFPPPPQPEVSSQSCRQLAPRRRASRTREKRALGRIRGPSTAPCVPCREAQRAPSVAPKGGLGLAITSFWELASVYPFVKPRAAVGTVVLQLFQGGGQEGCGCLEN